MITIDCRMWNASGIGIYLQNMVPRVIKRMPDTEFVLLGNLDVLAGVRANNCSVRPLVVPIYSIREQWDLALAIPEGTSLLWAPHYNIPVFSRVPLMVTIHDAVHVAMPELFPGCKKQLYAHVMFRAALKKARAVLTVSRFTADELTRLFGAWAERERIYVVPNGVDEAWFSIPSGKRSYARKYLLYVGNVKPHKNLRGLVTAYFTIMNSTDVDLVIVGERGGFLTGDPELMAVAKQLGNRVHFTGRVSFEDLQQYYAHARALVLPSFYEGFGLTVLEAMAAGCPVAVSGVASMPEVCGDAAVYFDPKDPIEMAEVIRQILEDDPLREILKKRGRKRAMEFLWDQAANRTVEIIRRVIGNETQPKRTGSSASRII